MRILFVTPYPPSQVRVRSLGFVRGLAELGHAVTVIALAGSREAGDISQVRPFCRAASVVVRSRPELVWRFAENAVAGRPLQAAYGRSSAMESAVRQLADPDGFDLVHVEHLRASPLGALADDLPRVYDSVDCISLLLRRAREGSPQLLTRLVTTLELERTERYEGLVGGAYDAVLVTSPEDRDALVALARRFAGERRVRPVHVVRNGVDLQHFSPGDDERLPDVLVYTGKMSYHANVASALFLMRSVMPLIWRERPQVQLWIVGKDPPRAVARLARDPRITVTGFVPDMGAYLRRASVAVAPIAYGVGIQNKVLEAMATGTPMVTSARVRAALRAEPGRDLLVADDPEGFARAVLDLLSDAPRRRELGAAGRAYVEQHHSWCAVAGDLEAVYREVLSGD